MEMLDKLDVFKNMLITVGKKKHEIAPTSEFIMEMDYKRQKQLFAEKVEKMVTEELKKKFGDNKEDFNTWVLATKAGGEKFSEATNTLLMDNLLLLRRHGNIGPRTCRLKIKDMLEDNFEKKPVNK